MLGRNQRSYLVVIGRLGDTGNRGSIWGTIFTQHSLQVCEMTEWTAFNIHRTVHRDIYSYNKTNEMHKFLKFILGIELYMFRTVSLSIIRSLALYTQQ